MPLFYSPCVMEHGECLRYDNGHATHYIQTRLAGHAPWGWRDAVVSAVDGLTVQLCYLQEDTTFSAWHHADLSERLLPGTPVRVNENYGGLLEAHFGLINIAHDSPLGKVPDPEHPELWAAETTSGLVGHSSWRLPLLGTDDEDL